MSSTSLVWNMDLPIPYDGPIQTSLECLRLHKRRNTKNYRRVMERIFYETKVTPEWPVTVKVFDDHMEFYPLYGRTVPLSKLCYKDVLCVLPSRDERKVLVVAIPAQDNSGGIWIVAMRFHSVDPVRSDPPICPPIPCIKPEICIPVANIPPEVPNICPKPIIKETITSLTEIVVKPPVCEPVEIVTCFICTPSPKKKCPQPLDCPTGNIKITEILIDQCANEKVPKKKCNFKSVYVVVPDNMDKKKVEEYIEKNPPRTVCNNEEFCVVIKKNANDRCPQEKIYIKKNANLCSESSFSMCSSSTSGFDSESDSDSCFLPIKNEIHKPLYCFETLPRCKPQNKRPIEIIVVPEKRCRSDSRQGSSSTSTCYRDPKFENIFIMKDNCLSNTYSGCKLIPAKELEIELLPNNCPRSVKKKPSFQDERKLCITPLVDKRRAKSEMRSVIPRPTSYDYICTPVSNGKSKKCLKFLGDGSFKLRILPLDGCYGSSCSSDESSESTVLRCSKPKKKKPTGRRETIQRRTVEVEKDFIIRKEIESDYRFLKEKPPKRKPLACFRGYESDENCCCRVNNVQLEYDLFSKLNCPRPKVEDEIVITREDLCAESSSSSSYRMMPKECASALADLSMAIKACRNCRPNQKSSSCTSNSTTSTCGKISRSKICRRPRRHSMDTIDEITEIDSSVSYVDFRKCNKKQSRKSSPEVKTKTGPSKSSYQVSSQKNQPRNAKSLPRSSDNQRKGINKNMDKEDRKRTFKMNFSSSDSD